MRWPVEAERYLSGAHRTMLGPGGHLPQRRWSSLDPLDRLALAYLLLPLVIFLAGWLEIWAALPLLLCLALAARPLFRPAIFRSAHLDPDRALPAAPPPTRLHLAVALGVGCAWTVFGGTGHLLFANADWHVRDAVLHDLVSGSWPVGYVSPDGALRLLRAPLGYYLPAALIGKGAGLAAAHAAMALWTAAGAALFLLLVLSRTPSRLGAVLVAAGVIVLFSGLDVVGTLLTGSGSVAHWDFTRHLEWWARRYQYSSMTTQLFWVPNHALCGWVAMGLLLRSARSRSLEAMLPILMVAVALCSPLTALGLIPFALLRAVQAMREDRSLELLHPRVWGAAAIVGLVVAAYLTLDSSRIPRSFTVATSGVGAALADLGHQAEFFLLEAGLVGAAILALRPVRSVVLALVILALLPLVSFGAANDFVMRASIPSLAALAVGASRALLEPDSIRAVRAKKALLGLLLALGAVTPMQEFARAAALPAWPIDRRATLIGAACGSYPPHYVARLAGQPIARLLRPVHPLSLGPLGPSACENPAIEIQRERDQR